MHAVMRIFGFVMVLAAFGLSIELAAQASDPTAGTWKLNLAKSKYNPGPPPKSLILKIETSTRGRKVSTDGVGADGKPTRTEYTANFDGKDYPIKGAPDVDMVALKRIDESTIERTGKKGGRVVQTITLVVSKDGKTLTGTFKGTNAQGQAYNNVVLWERQ